MMMKQGFHKTHLQYDPAERHSALFVPFVPFGVCSLLFSQSSLTFPIILCIAAPTHSLAMGPW